MTERLRAALDTAGIEDVQVIDDARSAALHLTEGRVVVLTDPPTLDFTTWDITTAEISVLVIAGPESEPNAAFDRIMPVIEALRIPLEADRAEPVTFHDVQGPGWPAYRLTSNHEWSTT
ncbi:hypothetical protein [Arthrobacter sp. UM1]|uniref:hypothetical protein n=1 Tax=Arthrobacter sp. UM1 TaxID=2766776 RepID=UPI001CF683F4|nr:hypothetical protein [Arthrobacter sp. UM1]MCB4209165.1 hypothetical protein [Arthrobacter sp. UM1]